MNIKPQVLFRTLPKIFTLVFIIFCGVSAFSQRITISGTVYDITKKTPVEAVSVLSTSGKGTSTDSTGRYSLTVDVKDSIYFSFLSKETPRYAVATIVNPGSFDISIMKKVQQLPNVFVKQPNYRLDSIQNRLEYEKIFNYRKPGVGIAMNSNPGGMPAVGLDLDEFISMFKFRKNRRMAAFQNRLLREEKERYVSHRFNKGLVRKLTGLTSPQLDSFMAEFRPTPEMILQMNDLELGQFIVEAYKYYKAGIQINKTAFRREER